MIERGCPKPDALTSGAAIGSVSKEGRLDEASVLR